MTGFIDGEGCFFIGVFKNSTMTLGYQVQLTFSITQHSRDKALLDSFVPFFQAGSVTPQGTTKYEFRIRSLDEFERVLFPMLDKYPLLTQKRHDAADFRLVHSLMKEGKHLTAEGLTQIKAIKAGTNRGRSHSNEVTSPPQSKPDDIVQV